jgi:hypothetical protein
MIRNRRSFVGQSAPPAGPLPRLWPLRDIASHLGLAPSSVHHWAQTGALPTLKIGRRRYARDEDVRALLTGQLTRRG